MIVVLDCNIWITLTINSQLDFIADLFDNDIIIASCDTLKSEIVDVLGRPRIQKYIGDTEIEKVVELHDLVTVYFKPGKLHPITKDSKDDYLFALAMKSKANYLVTGDKLLLEVDRYKNTRLLSLREFRNILAAL